MGDGAVDGLYLRREDVLARRIAGETVLVPISGELAKLRCIFSLSPVAEYIWERLDGQHTLAEILEEVLAQFEVDAAQAERDLRELLAELQSEDLVAALV